MGSRRLERGDGSQAWYLHDKTNAGETTPRETADADAEQLEKSLGDWLDLR